MTRRSWAEKRKTAPWVTTEGRGGAWRAVWLPLLLLLAVVAVLAGINRLVIEPLADGAPIFGSSQIEATR